MPKDVLDMAERSRGVETRRAISTFEVEDGNLGIRGLPRLMAAACGGAMLLDELEWRMGVAELGIRGQTFTGTRVSDERGAYTLDRYMSDFARAREALAAKSTALFGYSHGTYFTTQFALREPAQVYALVLVEPAALFAETSRLRRWADMAGEGNGVAALEDMVQYLSRGDVDHRTRQVEARRTRKAWQSDEALAGDWGVRAENPISEDHLAKLDVPTLIIAGSESPFQDEVKRAAGAIPNASVWYVRGADHLSVMEEHAATVAAAVATFVEQNDSA